MINRIVNMLKRAGTDARTMPPTELYNEGWLLRLALDWFERHADAGHAVLSLAVPYGARWYSEALLASPFLPRVRKDPLGEKHTHADGVIGHFRIGDSGEGDLALDPEATHFVVAEAKLGSRLSAGITNAPWYDQAARSVACMAHVMSRPACMRRPELFETLGFTVLAPASQIERGLFQEDLEKQSLREKVIRRVTSYEDQWRDAWLREWFLPTLDHLSITALSWETVAEVIKAFDTEAGESFTAFYDRCLVYNRLEIRDGVRKSPTALRTTVRPDVGIAASTTDAPRVAIPATDVARVAAFIQSLPDFEMVEDLALPYNHMGATITDAVLQAGLRYETVVWPRVQHVMEAFPEAATTSGFLTLLRERGGEEVVRWTHAEKLGRMEAVAELFIAEGVEQEADLRVWLCGEGAGEDAGATSADETATCRANVAKLLAVRGMGPKTVDYFKILCGEQDTAAIDMHLTRFLEQAGVRVTGYEQARAVIGGAAAELGVPAAQLDHSIWTYMSKAGKTWG